ncbi:hypothetical protein [Mesorhizobium sp.]|uniref:glycine-rich domain-containing protein n=1 Tax=Mesorhizobium sp. TaxID=1871066 RepID=UPI000FEA4A72|nr:hypothetical protein [Mesorhizobium sp.]RWO26485.1 MAG: hypothetical protein EOS09_07855 [Mesorhizobium sp.]
MSGPSDLNLWHRIEGYNFDQPDINLPFSARLARENGWPPEFAQRVVEEYKKFVYLMCVSDEMLTPSQEVDEAWHLHLVYTRSYWDNFCRGVLGRDIHHEPTEGGAAENAKPRLLQANEGTVSGRIRHNAAVRHLAGRADSLRRRRATHGRRDIAVAICHEEPTRHPLPSMPSSFCGQDGVSIGIRPRGC